MNYEEVYQLSISDPNTFWDREAKAVTWNKLYSRVLDDKEPIFPKWFVGGEINMCYNCLDKRVEEGFGNEIIVIYDSPLRKIVEKFTYQQLLHSVKLLAGVLVDKCGVKKGDRVLFYMPMVPQCMMGMLACTRIGAPYTVINSGFGYKEIAHRITHFEPKVIFTVNSAHCPSGYIDFKSKVDLAIESSVFSPDYCIVYNLPEHNKAKLNKPKDLDWEEELSRAEPKDPIPVESNHPIFVNYTSGTTGDPKALLMETGGAVVGHKYYLNSIYNLKPREPFFIMSSFSWILGGTVMSYGALLNRNPTIFYDGKVSDRADVLEFIRILDQHNVVALTCTPTVFRAMMKYGNPDDLELQNNKIKHIHLVGEEYTLKLKNWIHETFKCAVFDGWGQTESGYGIGAYLRYRSNVEDLNTLKSVLSPGLVPKIVDKDSGKELPNGRVGKFLLKLPLLPSSASTIYNGKQRFIDTYFKMYPGFYDTMDLAINHGDHIQVVSRDDDVIHVASTRISSTAVLIACLMDIKLEQGSVVALKDPIKGYVPLALLVPKDFKNCNKNEIINNALKNVKDEIGEVACFEKVVLVPDLPVNINGKVLKRSLFSMVNGQKEKVPQMAANPGVYKVIFDILKELGYQPSLPTES